MSSRANVKDDEIRVLTQEASTSDFPKKAFEILYKIEERHFWFAVRNEVIKIITNRFIHPSTNKSFLEIGCGNGFVLDLLDKLGFSLTGLDIYLEGLKLARNRVKSKLICADIYKLKPQEKYDAIGLFDVIEHIEDDRFFLKKSSGFLKTGGKIILTVPADMKLWSQIDQISGHKRRYTKKSLSDLLEKCGYNIEFISYFNFLLYVPQLMFRKFSNQSTFKKQANTVFTEQLRVPHPLVNFIFQWLFLLESQLLRITNIPSGASLIAVGFKKKTI